jgi:hypothetical protein
VRFVVTLVIAALASTGLVACGGEEETAAPLTLEQRVLSESEVPGSKADPVETRLTPSTLDEFTALKGTYLPAADIEADKLNEAGFVSALQDTRFIPNEPGGAHSPDAFHVRLLVIQFETEAGAIAGTELLHENELKPCPGECAVQFEEFDVADVPDARGVRSYATAERLKAIEEEGEPFDAYTISFADGPFAYEVEGFAPPERISEEQVEEIAQKLYDRVKGAPAGT